jgi:hypothetical protein
MEKPHIILEREGTYTKIFNGGGPRGSSAKISKFLGDLAKRGAFDTLSHGPMQNAHAIKNDRVSCFLAYLDKIGFTSEHRAA